MQENLLVLDSVVKHYGRRAILNGVNLAVTASERIAVMGPSGCGKTTLLNCVGAIDLPDQGNIYFDGKPLASRKTSELDRFRREQLGFIFQFFHLMPTLNVHENIELPMMMSKIPAPDRRRRVGELLDAVEMSHVSESLPGTLSGGEMQRVAIARAVALRPSLLLADEPTGNLDEATGRRTLDMLRVLCEETGTAMIMVTHSDAAASVCHRKMVLRDGHLMDSPVSPG